MYGGGGGGGEVKIGLLLFGSFKDFRWYRYNLNQQMQGSWVEHPVPRCQSCTPVLFGVHVNSPPPPPPPDKFFIIIPCETNIFSCHGDILNSLLEYFHHSDVRTEYFTKTASNTIEVDLF